LQTFDSRSALDDVSWRILIALQENARLSYSELGRRVGLTPPAVAERVRRLEEAGIITGYRVDLDLEKLGLTLTAIIRLAPRGRPSSELSGMLSSLPEILECHHVTGEDCYVMKVAVSSVHHLEAFIERLLRHGGESTTSLVLSSPVTHRVIAPAAEAAQANGVSVAS
jgi:Lrp/AsnC family leucine-responsive transcriptional regulator